MSPCRFRFNAEDKFLYRNFCLDADFFGISSARAQEGLKLWYDKPAGEWVEALPVGNGRIGAMVFGGVSSELIRLNESSLWSGCPVQDSLNIDAPCYLPLIRKALFEGDFSTAAQGCRFMQGPYSASYLPLGDLHISYMMPRSAPTDYYRALNLSEASAVTRLRWLVLPTNGRCLLRLLMMFWQCVSLLREKIPFLCISLFLLRCIMRWKPRLSMN